MKNIFLATGNKGKIKEISDILGIQLKHADIEVDEVQSMDLEYVARKKAESAFKILKKPLIVDDVGVYLSAWNNLPGPFVKYFYKLMGLPKLLKIMKKEKDRNLIVQCAVAYHDGKNIHTFLGIVKGKLALKELGKGGWGFDPVIIPNNQKLTFAQMGFKEKNKVSHRGRAFAKLKKFLDSKKSKKAI
jgi:XTP/dITP diphosphohydrolase